MSDVLHNYDVVFLLLLLLVAEASVEELEGYEEGSKEQEETIG